jgi:DNA-binding beta-propeller fold protein YncE
MEVLEHRLAPAVQLLYTGPGSTLSLTEGVSGATPTVAISESAPNLLKIDLGAGNHFDASSTSAAVGLAYSSGTPAASQSATVDIGRADNVPNLAADLAGDTLVIGGIMDTLGGLGNVTASAGTIRVTGLDMSHASVGNGNVDLKAAGDLMVGSPALPYSAILDTGPGTIALAADVNLDGSGNNGMGTLTVQPGSVVVSDNAGSSAITLRGAGVHLDAGASVGARRVLGNTATPFITAGLSQPYSVAFDASGNLYVANGFTNTVSKVAAGSTTATPFITSGLNHPYALAFDAGGNLYIANNGNSTVSKVAAGTSTATPFVTSGLNAPYDLAFDADSNLYVANFGGTTVSKVAAGTSTAIPFITAGVNQPIDLAFDVSGNLYVACYGTSTVVKVVAGTSTATPFLTGDLNGLDGLAFDASGNLYIANQNNNTVSKVAAGTTTVTPFITSGLNAARGVEFDAAGNLYVVNRNADAVSKVAAQLAPSVAGGVVIRSSLPNRPMLVGDTSSPVNGINLSSAELADIQTTATGTLTFGDDSQTGDITFRTARPASASGTAIVIKQAPDGPGRIVLDDAGAGSALDANGRSVRLTAGAGGVVAANTAPGLLEIATTAPVTLDTAGTAGTAASPLHVAAATLAAHAAGGLDLVTQVGQLAADGGIGEVSVHNIGNLRIASLSSLSGVTAAGAVSVRVTGDLVVSADVASTGAGNVLLQADGSLSVDPAALVEASAGALRLMAGFGALSGASTLTVRGDSLLASAALLDLGFDPGDICRLVPGGSTPITVDSLGNGQFVLDDAGNGTSRGFTVTATTVAWGGPALTYAGLGRLTINGGSGGNTFTVLTTAAAAPVTLVGGGSGDTLAGANGGNLFVLAGSNAGALSGNSYGSSVVFSGVGNLSAGSGDNYFTFTDGAALSGNLAGGAGTLDYRSYTTSVVVDLQTGFATGVGGLFSGIVNVIGGSGPPAAGGTYNLLIGNGGNMLTGGTGRRNILVAGGRASILVPGDNEDLLIAGSTSYDSDPALANWRLIAAYWAGSDDFFTRAFNLLSGTGVPLLDATIVTGNGGGNTLLGSGARALIFSDDLDTLGVFAPNSLEVRIAP